MNYFYTDYYQRTIEQHATGLKLVLGGTGLGKTSSLADLLRSGEYPVGVKFIYVANRIQLLDEMAEAVKPLNLHLQQRSNADHLLEVVRSGELLDFIDSVDGGTLVDLYNERNPLFTIKRQGLRQQVRQFKKLDRFSPDEVAELVDIDRLAWQLMDPLKRLLAFARGQSTKAPTRSRSKATSQTKANDIAQLPLWNTLFPLKQFQEDATKRLLLVTVQKAFRGIFNGQRSVRLGSWQAPSDEQRYVFVFDEFDFLENDLLTMLSEDKEVTDPFVMVRTFYERIKSQKLSHPDYLTQEPAWLVIRQKIEVICKQVEVLKERHSIDFPAITHFVTRDKAIKKRAIFQSNYTLVSQPVFLHDAPTRPASFELTTDRKGKSAFMLLDIVSRTVKDIIRLFKWLESEHENVYPELLRQCFGGTDYQQEVRRIKQIGWQHEWCETNYGHLLTNGFGLYEVRTDQSKLTDPDEVALRYLSMNNSPEAIMRAMCDKHLVFGLSATAHIKRALRNFDWTGLSHPLRPNDSFEPLLITEQDEADIYRANTAKAAVRNNSIQFSVAEPVSLDSQFGQQLAGWADLDEDVFGTGQQRVHRLARAQHFFGLLSWVVRQPDVPELKTHLVFLSSVKQVGYVLGNVDDNDGWFSATKKPLPPPLTGLELFDVTYRDELSSNRIAVHVVLYDARFGQALRKEPALEAQYNALFWDEKPVIVVTTYPSAGNGVNLQYYLTKADYDAKNSAGKRDFINLHLLDSPYFYFSGTKHFDVADDELAAIKRDVYGVMKLHYAQRISEAQAVAELGHIRQINEFNSTYLKLPDGVSNQFSVFVQALGRIERVWQPTLDQTVRMDAAVYKVFERFVANDELAIQRQQYMNYASATMRNLLKAVEQHAQVHRDEVEDALLDIRRQDVRCQDRIHQLVLDIQAFQRSGQPATIRQQWQQLREDVLKHNMQADSLQRIGGVFQTSYVSQGQLQINRDGQVAPLGTHSHEFDCWNLNGVYHALTVIPNTSITNYFQRRGYMLGFVESGYCLLPYVYQSILMGAVGEEAAQAILQLKQISASPDNVPDALFEVADLCLEDRPIFVDCKNYGGRTLRYFALPVDDPLHNPSLNESLFKEKMQAKWATIQAVVGSSAQEPPRLIVFNLTSDNEGALRYYDAHFEEVQSWDEARIIVLTGALKRQPPDAKDLLTPACITLLNHLK